MQVRVYYEDTDFTGIVYHANYLRFMERGRTNYLRLIGADHRALFEQAEKEAPSFAFVVRSMRLDFRKPAFMDDLLEVRSLSREVSGASIVLVQRVMRGEEVLVEAEVRVAPQRRVDVAALSWHARAIASRGALDTTFRQDLYRVPYGRGFYDGFVATSGDIAVEDGTPFVVVEGPRGPSRFSLAVGYQLSSSPYADFGVTNGIDARFRYRYWKWLDIGLGAEVGYGSGGLPGEWLLRAALLGNA